MGQIKIELARNTYSPQKNIRGTIKLSVEELLDPKSVKLKILGLEKTFIQSAHKRAAFTYSENNYIIKDEIPLQGLNDIDKELAPGEYEFHFEYPIPQYALPSYSGSHASISYNLNAEVENPEFQNDKSILPILIQKEKKVPHMFKQPSHFKSPNYFNPNDLNPGLYVELAQTGYLAGEDIWGYITLKNTATLSLKNIVLELIGEEFAYAQKHHISTAIRRIKKDFPIHDIKEGTPLQFTFPTQKDIPAGYEGMFSSLKWTFQVRLDISSLFKVKAQNQIDILG